MKITLLTPGKFKSEEYFGSIQNYLKLAGRFVDVEHLSLTLPTRSQTPEDDALKKYLDSSACFKSKLVILHERGRLFNSREFAHQLEKWRDSSIGHLIFAVGGAHEYGSEIQNRALLKLSLSPLTFAHELAATVLAEQLFRGFSILANHPYHND